jgi:hypothetical protein
MNICRTYSKARDFAPEKAAVALRQNSTRNTSSTSCIFLFESLFFCLEKIIYYKGFVFSSSSILRRFVGVFAAGLQTTGRAPLEMERCQHFT